MFDDAIRGWYAASASSAATPLTGVTDPVGRRVNDHSRLALDLQLRWGFGYLSALQTAELGASSCADWRARGLEPPTDLAALGRIARASRNCNVNRDLLRLTGLSNLPLVDVYFAELPVKKLNGTVEKLDWPFILLSDWMAYLQENFPSEYKARVTGDADALEHFWRTAQENADAIAGLPLLQPRDDRRGGVPFSWHQDAVPFTKKSSLNVYSCSSMLGRGSSLLTKLLITVMSKDARAPGTEVVIFEVFKWMAEFLEPGCILF